MSMSKMLIRKLNIVLSQSAVNNHIHEFLFAV